MTAIKTMNELIRDLTTQNGLIVCEENGKKLEFDCRSGIFYKVHIDGGKLPNNQTKCDYVVVSSNLTDIALFVELKGSGKVDDAFKQIIATNNILGSNFKLKYGAIVYGGSIPAKTNSQIFTDKGKKYGLQFVFLKGKLLKLRYNDGKICINK